MIIKKRLEIKLYCFILPEVEIKRVIYLHLSILKLLIHHIISVGLNLNFPILYRFVFLVGHFPRIRVMLKFLILGNFQKWLFVFDIFENFGFQFDSKYNCLKFLNFSKLGLRPNHLTLNCYFVIFAKLYQPKKQIDYRYWSSTLKLSCPIYSTFVCQTCSKNSRL